MTKYRHGMAKTKIYGIWWAMRSRCENPRTAAYKNYGGRGINVCERWKIFENFYEDMGDRPDGMSLERVNNDAGYSPENCVWADKRTQCLNRRNLRMLTIGDECKSMGEWADISGIPLPTIWHRLKLGWEVKDAVFCPKVKERRGIKRGILVHKPDSEARSAA